MPSPTKEDWLLLLLREKPMDRIHLMKALFLIWHHSDRNIDGFFEFVPYMYGPCSFDFYSELDAAIHGQLVSQAPKPISQWAPYFLTAKGIRAAEVAEQNFSSELLYKLRSIADEVSSLDFRRLLQRVYSEAPDFASQSLAT